jgi:hypothetical protein
VEINFENSKVLSEFILSIQKKTNPITEHFSADKFNVDFPYFMISVLRKMKMAAKKHTVRSWDVDNQKGQQVQQQWAQNQQFYNPNTPMNQMLMTPMMYPAPFPQQNHAKPTRIEFRTHADILKFKDQFLALSEKERKQIKTKLLCEKLKGFPHIFNMFDN